MTKHFPDDMLTIPLGRPVTPRRCRPSWCSWPATSRRYATGAEFVMDGGLVTTSRTEASRAPTAAIAPPPAVRRRGVGHSLTVGTVTVRSAAPDRVQRQLHGVRGETVELQTAVPGSGRPPSWVRVTDTTLDRARLRSIHAHRRSTEAVYPDGRLRRLARPPGGGRLVLSQLSTTGGTTR